MPRTHGTIRRKTRPVIKNSLRNAESFASGPGRGAYIILRCGRAVTWTAMLYFAGPRRRGIAPLARWGAKQEDRCYEALSRRAAGSRCVRRGRPGVGASFVCGNLSREPDG